MNRIKNFLVILVVLVVVAIAAWNVNFNSQKSNFSDTMLANVEALASPETGAGITSQEGCAQASGYWNMALVITNSGVMNISCEIAGQLTFMGLNIFNASYSKGSTYQILWQTWSCSSSQGNCCIASSQGVEIVHAD